MTDCINTDERGCELANAAVELTEIGHPARRLIETFKRDWHERLVGLCRSAGIAQADLLADGLLLLVEGARVNRQNVGADGPNANFVRVAGALIASMGKVPEPA